MVNTNWRESRVAILVVSSLAVFVDMLVYGTIIPIQPTLLKECGIAKENIDFYQSILFGSLAVGLFVSVPIFGIVSDRLKNRKVPMLLGLLALAITTIFFAFTRVFALLVVARIAQGISAAATWVVGFAMIADVYPSDDGLGFAAGIAIASYTVGGFCGPVIGGFLGEYYGLEYPFLFCAALVMVDFLGRLIINPPKPRGSDTLGDDSNGRPKSPTEQVGMIALLKNHRILKTLVAVLIISASYSSVELFGASWLIQDWGFTESQTSLCLLSFIVPNMLGSVGVGWLADRLPRHYLISAGLLVHGLVVPLFPLARELKTLLLFSGLVGGSASLVSAPIIPHLTTIVDQMGGASYARVYAIFNMTWSLGMLLGPWIIGFIKSMKGFFVGMLIIGICSLVYSPLYFYFGGVSRESPAEITSSMKEVAGSA